MGNLTRIINDLKQECGIEFLDIDDLANFVIDKRLKKFYLPIGGELVRYLPEKLKILEEKLSLTEKAMFQFHGSSETMEDARGYWETRHNQVNSWLNNCKSLGPKFFTKAIKDIIDSRKPKGTFSSNYYRFETKPDKIEENESAHKFNENFLEDVKTAIRLANLAYDNKIEINDKEFLDGLPPNYYPLKSGSEAEKGKVFSRLWCLYQTLWAGIQDFYAFTTHDNLVDLGIKMDGEMKSLFGTGLYK